jgi:1-aminocyclopropane-1-carboxylate deaminase/D-cysteine desulfhydrase-like pyridoxal-dependent ACC family enzyme
MNEEKAQKLEEAIGALPRIELASILPTPLEHLPRLSATLGGPQIYIKRDDLTGLGFGGNKTRMLEFSLADAQAKGADIIVTGAAVQSNYCRQIAAACARLGLDLELILRPLRDIDQHESQGNNLLQHLFGAKITVLDKENRPRQQELIQARYQELKAEGRTPYCPRRPDTVDLDALAYAESGLEIAHQCRELGINPSYIYLCAVDTTQAGVVLALENIASPIKVRGFSPLSNQPDRCADMAQIANQGAQRLDLDTRLEASHFDNDDTFVGVRYGIPTEAGLEALHTVARSEGILLDPVYTSKAMAGLFAHIRTGRLSPDQPVVFLHTGGAPALFGYATEVLAFEL